MTDYFQVPALNVSTAKKILVSPAQARHALDAPDKTTPAMQRGTRLHMAVLEPERFKGVCIAGPDLSGVRTKDGKPAANPAATTEGKAIAAAFAEANPDADVMTDAERADVIGMRDALLASEVGHLFESAECECEVYWTEDDVDRKAKIDALALGCIIDLKTYGGEWSERAILRAAFDNGWHMQGAQYQEAGRIKTGAVLPFYFAVVQSSAPYEVAVLKCTDAFLTHGKSEMDRAAVIYRTCMASGVWPSAQSVGTIGGDLGLPDWLARKNTVASIDAELGW